MPVASAPPPARTRDRVATEERILAAVGEVLARDGFAAVGVNAIAREAGVDKVLIYRYFGGLPELLRTWGASGRFWPSVEELIAEMPGPLTSLPLQERYALFFERFIDALRARPLTLEILAAEIVTRNELTAILETERESWGAQAESTIGGDALQRLPQLRGLTLLLVAGVQYLLVRSRTIRIFGGLDLRSDAAWDVLKASVRHMAMQMLADEACPQPAPATRRAATRRGRQARQRRG